MSSGDGRVCDACGESFRTLSRLRMHETDDCPERETYAEFTPGDPNLGPDAAEGLLTCRDCGTVNGNADYDQKISHVDDSLHMIVEFECAYCRFMNENRVVMEGVDPGDIEKLPPHLRPDDESEGGR